MWSSYNNNVVTWPAVSPALSRCEACEASGQGPTVTANTGNRKKNVFDINSYTCFSLECSHFT